SRGHRSPSMMSQQPVMNAGRAGASVAAAAAMRKTATMFILLRSVEILHTGKLTIKAPGSLWPEDFAIADALTRIPRLGPRLLGRIARDSRSAGHGEPRQDCRPRTGYCSRS